MQPNGAQRIEAALAKKITAGASPASIAESACTVWQGITAALSPIVGTQGVAAFFKRSLHLTRAEHPVLTAVYAAASDPGDYAALRQALASNPTSAGAAAVNGALLVNFQNLLSGLIGESLTERLLKPATDIPSTDPHTPQDPPP
jgi:hypothetical protein